MFPVAKFELVLLAMIFTMILPAWLTGHPEIWKPAAAIGPVVLAIALRFSKQFRNYQFTAWIIAAVTVAMIYPQWFSKWGGFDLQNKWVKLLVVQTVMFGMGTQMSLQDFAGVVKNPRGVFVGIFCHFTVMPLVGLALTKLFHFEPEIAAGIILIGSCSSGLASNVMAYIAKSNLALSVTVTAMTTVVAPFITPFWVKWLAGAEVTMTYFGMMMEIIKIVIVPIGAALLHDYLKHASSRGRTVVQVLATLGAVWLGFVAFGGWGWLKESLSEDGLVCAGIFGFFCAAIVFGVVYHRLSRVVVKLDSWMPAASMAGIVYFTTITTAAGRDNLLKVGLLLFLASVIHNALGYVFGYWLSRASGLDKNSARSVAFEVGLQNGAMASGLAAQMGKLGTIGLAAAIFSPWMNVSGSVLANYWRRHPAK
ncbi:MAG: bile acid:sodium symporter family protein [Verrucomicrobiota bacterium]